jgi:hypothetical protein
MGIVAVISLLLGALNFFGSIVAVVWLLILGEWRIVLGSIAVLVIAPLALGLLLLPGMLFGAPALSLAERRHTGLAVPFTFLTITWTHVVISAWALAVFLVASAHLTQANFWPLLLWSYGVAVGPWSYMAAKEQTSAEGGLGSGITLFFTQLAYVVMLGAGVVFRLPIGELFLVFASVMVVSVLLQTALTTFMMAAEQRQF